MKKAIVITILVLFGALTAAPLVFLVCGSLMGSGELAEYLAPVLESTKGYARWRLFPLYPTLRNLVELCFDSPEFFQMFWNTMKITVGILAGQLVFGLPSAWGLARYPIPGKRFLYFLYILLMMLPFQVTMLSQYLVLNRLHLMDTTWAVIVPGVFSTFSVFLMYRFFCGIPEELLEAARIDGAGEWALFWKLGLPIGKGGLLSAMVLGFLEYWNLMEQPMAFLKDASLWPLSLYLPQITLSQAGFAFCASVMMLIPAVFVFALGQDHLEQGIIYSGLKG